MLLVAQEIRCPREVIVQNVEYNVPSVPPKCHCGRDMLPQSPSPLRADYSEGRGIRWFHARISDLMAKMYPVPLVSIITS